MPRILTLALWIGMSFATASCQQEKSGEAPATDTAVVPREATDPVPAPPNQPDTANNSSIYQESAANILYKVSGTEPFWSLKIGRPFSTFTAMNGDSLSFPYQAPQHAQARPEEYLQLFPLGNNNWVLLSKKGSPCSDGMSDKAYTYSATLWLNGQLLDGCAEKP